MYLFTSQEESNENMTSSSSMGNVGLSGFVAQPILEIKSLDLSATASIRTFFNMSSSWPHIPKQIVI